MTTAYNPAEVERLVREARRRYAATGTVGTAADALDMADQLDAARDEVAISNTERDAARTEADRLRRYLADTEETLRVVRVASIERGQEADQLRSDIVGRDASIVQLVAQRDEYLRQADQQRARVAELEGGWRTGIQASIRRLELQQRKPRDLWHAAYFAALDEALIHLRAMLERGTERQDGEQCT